jgi:hypothetical protein
MHIFRLVLVLLLVIACKRNTEKLPQGILSPDQMKNILIDVHLAKGARMQHLLPEELTKNPERVLLEITLAHNTDTTTFQASYRYYVARPEQFKKIYEEVISAIETAP